MEKFDFEGVGPVYKFWYKCFYIIENMLPFSLLRRFGKIRKIKNFSDYWVVAHFILSFSMIYLITASIDIRLKALIVGYAAIRVLEILVYQINVLLFHPYQAYLDKQRYYKVSNPYRSVILLFHNFGEVIFWFTVINRFFGYGSNQLVTELMNNAIRVFTFDYEKMTSDNWFQAVIFIEVLSGLILTIVSLAKFIGELPHTHIEFKYPTKH